jgi:hypothetical protein
VTDRTSVLACSDGRRRRVPSATSSRDADDASVTFLSAPTVGE